MSEELKPCPWCGNKPNLWEPESAAGYWDITCNRAASKDYGAPEHYAAVTNYESKAAAIAAWNRRADQQERGGMMAKSCKECRHWFPPSEFYRGEEQAGVCWRFPKWENTQDEHFCDEFKPKEDKDDEKGQTP